jgi:hypothetical protein
MKTMKTNTKVGLASLGFAICGVVYLFISNPQKLPPILLIPPFLLFYAALFLAIVCIATLVGKSTRLAIGRKSFLLSLIFAAYPVMLLLLQSIGQLSSRDVVTLTLLLIISTFYVTRSGPNR